MFYVPLTIGLSVDPYGYLNYRFGPVRGFGIVRQGDNLSLSEVENHLRLGEHSCCRVTLDAVIKQAKLGDLGKKTNQILPTALKPLTYRGFWDVVTTPCQAGPNARNMKICRRQTYELHPDFHAAV